MSDTTPTPDVGHETRDVWFRPVLVGGALIIAMVLMSVAGTVWLYDALAGREAARSAPANPLAADVSKLPPEPRLQAMAADDLRSLRGAEQAVLDGYGWLDRDAGVARIPIDRAMDLLAAGKSARPEGAP
jgi:hypothetical protein